MSATSVDDAKDLDVVAATLVSVLAFPIGILVTAVITVVFGAASAIAISAVLWIVAIALGYWQWFILLPKFFEGVRRAASR